MTDKIKDTFYNYLRMCNYYKDCDKCPIERKNGCDCVRYGVEHYDEISQITNRWAEEHPEKTILQDFLEKYPNAILEIEDNKPIFCCKILGYEHLNCDNGITCKECWNKPLLKENYSI